MNKLLPEMKEKVTDMEEMKKDSKDRLQKAAKASFPIEVQIFKGDSFSEIST